MKKILVVLGTIMGLISTPVVFATPSWQGTVWSLSTSGIDIDTNPETKTYGITLQVDSSGYTGSGSFLDQVAVKVSNSFLSSTLVNAPGGLGNWSLISGGINADGCSGSGAGFNCADSVTISGGAAVPGGIYSWVFDLTMNNSTMLFTGVDESSVKGRFVDVFGNKQGDLVSERTSLNVTPIPEPETYTMLLAGLGLMGFVARRRKQREAI